MGKEKIRKQLTLFLRRVQKFYPQKVILCGSYAQKKANEYSDVDIVVVSDMFDGISEKIKLKLQRKLLQNGATAYSLSLSLSLAPPISMAFL